MEVARVAGAAALRARAGRSRSTSTASASRRARTSPGGTTSSSSPRELKHEGKLGFWRWTSLFLGVAGTYRQNDSVDVVYDVDGKKDRPNGVADPDGRADRLGRNGESE